MTNDRAMLLADVAEKYFIDGKTQTEIAKEFGVDRSMISRMLTEARKKGIIRIQINRSIARNYTYEEEIRKRFGLKEIYVVSCPPDSSNEITLDRMGNVGAYFLNKILLEYGAVYDWDHLGHFCLCFGETVGVLPDVS